MSDKYKIRDNDKAYFITITTDGWIDVFTRKNQKLLIIDSLKYCQNNKGLIVFGYCLMSNHLHMICKADDGYDLSNILRDFKTFTSKSIIMKINEEPESRREWMLEYFSNACRHLKKEQKYKVWQDGNQAKEIYSNKFLFEKLNYMHQNPVKELIVENHEDYIFSSARNYAGLENNLEIVMVDNKLITY
ncbi:MAG: transposase [Bacteroidales bacterium]|nr:transposase [Bacteroidales bacterium]